MNNSSENDFLSSVPPLLFFYYLRLLLNTMTDKLLDKINTETFKNSLYLTLVFPFWVISFYLFKPEFLKENYVIIFSFLFGLSFTWLILSYLFLQVLEINILLIIKKLPLDISKIRVEIYLFSSFILKCISILVGYYYSFCFTDYLKFAYFFIGTLSITNILTLLVIKQVKKQQKNKKQ